MNLKEKVIPVAVLVMGVSLALSGCSGNSGETVQSSSSQAQSGTTDTPTVDRDPSGELPEITGEAGSLPEMTTVSADPPENITVKLLDEGDGDVVGLDDIVTVNYAGWLWSDGTLFDSSYDRGSSTFSLNSVIEGWKYGLAGQSVGDRVELIVPAEYGYGEQELDGIPAGSTLVFVVEILGSSAVDTTELENATATGNALPSGMIIDGSLGEQPVIGFEEGATAPTSERVIILAEGNGATIADTDQIVYHYVTVPWGETSSASTSWETGAVVSSASGTLFLGSKVGTRILSVSRNTTSGEMQVTVFDLVAAYDSDGS